MPILLLALLVVGAPTASAQQFALRTYTARDGLAHGHVTCIHQDRLGYLWFGTWEGLSCFDGHRFTGYGVGEGLPNPFVTCIREDAAGGLWVGTLGGGFARLRERTAGGERSFEAFDVASTPRANDVFELLFAPDGQLWLGTGAGIYRATVGTRPVAIGSQLALPEPDIAGTLSSAGEPLFFANTTRALVRDGALTATTPGDAVEHGPVATVVRDGDDLYVVRARALLHGSARTPAAPLQPVPVPLRENERLTTAIREAESFWVGTNQGLLERRADGAWRRYGTAQGLPDDWVTCLAVDADRTLWIATFRGGLARIADRSVATFGTNEGFADRNVARVVEASDGTLYASTDTGGIYEVLDDRVVRLQGAPDRDLDSVHIRICCDARGDFWLGTAHGLWSCAGPRLDLARCTRVTAANGSCDASVCAEVRPTPTGEVWFGADDRGVYRRTTDGRWQLALTLPAAEPAVCRIATPAADGSLLVATFDRLLRARDGTVTDLALASPQLLRPRCVFVDADGWTWIGTRFLGVFVERPAAAGGPLHLTTRDGLTADSVWSITADRRGRVFFGTSRGVSCYDHGAIRAFAGSDRLAGEVVHHLACDRRGRLWVATNGGLSRIDLDAPRQALPPPRVYLTNVRIDGVEVPMPANGSERFTGLVLTPGQRSLEVMVNGIDLHDARPPRFQHQLLGIDADWSPATPSNTVQFADLAPGSYRFHVRAIDSDGRTSTPAELTFGIEPPLWRRGWFLALATASGLAMVWLLHRSRLRGAIATERLRTQIATDLHDEVGAGLAQIAITSEVARQAVEPGMAAQLGEVATLARSLREGMSDIVWALSRDQGTLGELVHRMQELASRLLDACGAQVAFHAPPAGELTAAALSLEQRRQLWLWFREALTNVARHAAPRTVDIALTVAAGRLRLSLRDDGVGFDAQAPSAGNGLPSLHARASRLGGAMQVRSSPGAGTDVQLDVPLRRRPA